MYSAMMFPFWSSFRYLLRVSVLEVTGAAEAMMMDVRGVISRCRGEEPQQDTEVRRVEEEESMERAKKEDEEIIKFK